MSIKPFYLIILAISSTTCQFLYDCPKLIIPGCNCVKPWANSNYNIKVQCTAISDKNPFEDNLKNYLKGYAIDEFWLVNYLYTSLPDEVFKETSITSITIYNSPKLLKFGKFFDGLGPYLNTIRIESTPNIDRDQWVALATSLAVGAPLCGPVLKNILLFNNINANGFTFRSLDDSLITLRNIERIVNRKNNIRYFTISATFPKLMFIDLSDNVINEDNFKVDSPAPVLSNIYLQNNLIESITSDTIDQIPYIRLLDLSNNRIRCNCDDLTPICSVPELAKNVKGNCYSPQQYAGTPISQVCSPRNNITNT